MLRRDHDRIGNNVVDPGSAECPGKTEPLYLQRRGTRGHHIGAFTAAPSIQVHDDVGLVIGNPLRSKLVRQFPDAHHPLKRACESLA